jgi:hypothetical protein
MISSTRKAVILRVGTLAKIFRRRSSFALTPRNVQALARRRKGAWRAGAQRAGVGHAPLVVVAIKRGSMTRKKKQHAASHQQFIEKFVLGAWRALVVILVLRVGMRGLTGNVQNAVPVGIWQWSSWVL